MGAHLHMVWDQGALWTCQRLVTYCSLMLIERECWCPVITDGDHIVILTFNRKSSDRTHIVLSGMRSKFGNQHLLKKNDCIQYPSVQLGSWVHRGDLDGWPQTAPHALIFKHKCRSFDLYHTHTHSCVHKSVWPNSKRKWWPSRSQFRVQSNHSSVPGRRNLLNRL